MPALWTVCPASDSAAADPTRSGSLDVPGFYEITFLPEGRVEQFAGSRGNYYEFEDGCHLDVETRPVWCRRCGRVTHGEAIASLVELDRQLADLDDPASELYRLTMRPLLPEFETPGSRER